MKKYIAILVLPLIIGLNSITHAEDAAKTAGDEKNAEHSDARFMLRSETSPAEIVKTKVTADDFTWNALTKNGPANGSIPAIGKLSGKAYYDFKDGQPFPYFVAQKTK